MANREHKKDRITISWPFSWSYIIARTRTSCSLSLSTLNCMLPSVSSYLTCNFALCRLKLHQKLSPARNHSQRTIDSAFFSYWTAMTCGSYVVIVAVLLGDLLMNPVSNLQEAFIPIRSSDEVIMFTVEVRGARDIFTCLLSGMSGLRRVRGLFRANTSRFRDATMK